jgi:hypothetical protein
VQLREGEVTQHKCPVKIYFRRERYEAQLSHKRHAARLNIPVIVTRHPSTGVLNPKDKNTSKYLRTYHIFKLQIEAISNA